MKLSTDTWLRAQIASGTITPPVQDPRSRYGGLVAFALLVCLAALPWLVYLGE